MKNWNLFSFVFVAGVSFAAIVFSGNGRLQLARVKVKQVATQTNYTCETVNLPDGTCNGLSANNCVILIQLSPTGSAPTVAYSDTACSVTLKDSTANTTVYDINPTWDPQTVQPA